MGFTKLLLIFIAAYIQIHSGLPVSKYSLQVSESSRENTGVSQLIRQLYSKNKSECSEARERLSILAAETDQGRMQVIRALIQILEDPEALSIESGRQTWYAAAEILGDLRAIEALDSLIKYLDFNDGTIGSSPNHFPALAAVIKIGEPAVPKLIEALFEGRSVLCEWEPSIRQLASRALGNIGGDQAKEALESALNREVNKEVILTIESSLSLIRRQSEDKLQKKEIIHSQRKPARIQ